MRPFIFESSMMRKYLYFALTILISSISLIGCSKKPYTPLSPNATILAFGDSLTAGYGTTPENSYPSSLAKLSGHPVINAGISGETTAQGLARFATVLDQTKPELVILMEGGNDILQNLSQKTAQQNLQQMIDLAKLRKIQILLVAVPAKSFFSSSADFYEQLAEQNKLVLDDSTIAKLMKNPQFKSDYVHYNQQGYAKMAEHFYDELKDNGALK